jgi:hypothetical protein
MSKAQYLDVARVPSEEASVNFIFKFMRISRVLYMLMSERSLISKRRKGVAM